MRNSLRRVVGGGLLFVSSMLACSSRDTPEDKTAVAEEKLTASEITRILSFEGTIGATGDWVPSGGTVVSSTAHATVGTHSMVMSSASSISVMSTSISALGTVGANLGVDIWLPLALNGQSNKGNIQAFFTSTTLSLNSYPTTNVQLTSLSPGQFSRINLPLDSTLQSKLSQSGYTDLKVKLAFSLADTGQTFVDNLTFNAGTGGAGGATGTGGSKSNGGSSGIGGTKSTGGVTNSGGRTGSGGASTAGGGSSGGTNSTGGASGTISTGGKMPTGGTTFAPTGGTPATGGNVPTGGAIVIITPGTGGAPVLGGASALGGTTSAGGAAAGSSASGGMTGTTTTSGSPSEGGSTGTHGTGGSTVDNGGSGGSSGSSASDVTFSFRLPEGVRREQVAVATSGGDLWLNDSVKTVSDTGGFASVSSIGGNVRRLGVETEVQNVWTTGSVTLTNRTWVHGSVMAFGAVQTEPDSKINGGTAPMENPAAFQNVSWQVHFPAVSQPPIFIDANQVLAPGSFPSLTVRTGAHLTLTTGTYKFDSLLVDPGATIDVDNSGGALFVYILDGFIFRGVVNRFVSTPNVMFGVAGTSPIPIDAPFTGLLIAPNAEVTLATAAQGHRGAFFAKSITAQPNTTITLEPLEPSNFCAADAACSSFCPCVTGVAGCTSDDQCDTGIKCSPTGVCGCQPQCAGKTCGGDTSDGCGGVCPGVCGHGQVGCTSDIQCTSGAVCIIGGGPKKGGLPGSNVCLSAICGNTNPHLPNCGVGDVDCGTCPACVPDCEDRVCGPDGCGGQCGATPSGQFCVGGLIALPSVASGDHSSNFPPPLPDAPGSGVGALPATLGVSNQGRANYTIPIEVPPGRAGLQPQLAVQYQGTNINGMLGMGWALTGLSRIERCRKTVAQDGEAKGVELNAAKADVSYCLDGQKLLADKESWSVAAPTHTHHTEVESFKIIEAAGSDTGPDGSFIGPESFKVWTKHGLIMTYGKYSDTDMISGASALLTSGQTRVAWYLSKVEDRVGNRMVISYLKHGNEVLPSSIGYGGNFPTYSIDRSVTFEYSSRTDLRSYSVGGMTVYSYRLLTAVQTQIGDNPVRRYQLDYQHDMLDNSQLVSVKLCGPSLATCLPPTTFEYQQLPTDLGTTITSLDFTKPESCYPPSSCSNNPPQNLQVFDWDADGRDELLNRSASAKIVANGTKSFSISLSVEALDPLMPNATIMDVDNDGHDDLMIPSRDSYLPGAVHSKDLGPPQSLGFKTTVMFGSNALPLPTFVGDFNGDGLKDIGVCGGGLYLHKYPFEGTSLFNAPIPASASTVNLCKSWLTLDYTGSGADTIFELPSDIDRVNVLVLDTDGDGRKEIAYAKLIKAQGAVPEHVSLTVMYLADGNIIGEVDSRDLPAAIATELRDSGLKNALIEDYDRDGRDDIIFPKLGGLFHSRGVASLDWIDSLFPALQGRFILADLDGDGDKEWVGSTVQHFDTFRKDTVTAYLGVSARTGLLTNVTDGLGKISKIGYGSNYEAHTYWEVSANSHAPDGKAGWLSTPPSNAVQYLRTVGPLVSGIRETQNGIFDGTYHVGFQRVLEYRYKGAVNGLGGRGFLGFWEQDVSEVAGGAELKSAVTQYYAYNGFPLAAYPSSVSTKTWVSQGKQQGTSTTYYWNSGRSGVSGGWLVDLVSTRTSTSDDIAFADPDCLIEQGPFCLLPPFLQENSYQYDLFGNLKQQSDSTTLASNFELTTTVTTSQSDSEHWLITNPLSVAITSLTNNSTATRSFSYEYYDNGLLKSQTREPNSSKLYLKTSYDREDPVSRNISKVHVTDFWNNERTSAIKYNSRQFFVSSITNSEGQTTEVQYDDASGRLQTHMDPNGIVTQWAYDSFGRLAMEITPTDTVTRQFLPASDSNYPFIGPTWDAMTIVETSEANGTSSVTLDNLGRKTRVSATGLGGTTISSEYGYDPLGRLWVVAEPHAPNDTSQGASYYTYDGLERVTSVTSPGAPTTTRTYVGRNASVNYTWLFEGEKNSAMRAVVEHAPGNQERILVTDIAGRPLRSIQIDGPPDGAAGGLPNVGVADSGYKYGAFGMALAVTDPDGEVTTITPDVLGRRMVTSNASTGTHSFNYDAFGEVIDDTDGNGTKYCHYYDSLGRERELRRPLGSNCDPTGHLIARWGYDDGDGNNDIGRLVLSYRESRPGSGTGTTQYYHYEPLPSTGKNTGRLSSVEQSMPETGNALVTSLDYDGPRLSKVHYPAVGGQTFTIKYDYDAVGNLTAVRDPNSDSTFWQITEYDAGLRIKTEQFGNQVTTTSDYLHTNDCATLGLERCQPGSLLALTTRRSPSTEPLQQFSYTYQASGDLKTRNTLRNSTSQQEQFHVNGLGQLVEHASTTLAGSRLTQYFYSAGGDLHQVLHDGLVAENYTYDQARKHVISQHDDVTYLHDSNGSQLARTNTTVPGSEQTLGYNDFAMPWRIATGSDITYLEYGASGARVAKRGNDRTTLYVGNLYDCTGSVVAGGPPFACNEHHYNVYAGSTLVAQVTRDASGATTATRYVHADHLGSASLVTKEDGTPAETRDFDPFGQTSTNLATSTIHAGFTGHEHDPELGLINMQGRLYDASLRRFITADPYVTNPLNPQGLNRYSYVQNNPLNNTDPSGFDCIGSSECGYESAQRAMAEAATMQGHVQATIQTASNVAMTAAAEAAARQSAAEHAESAAQQAASQGAPATQNEAMARIGGYADEASARAGEQAQAERMIVQDTFRQHDLANGQPYTPVMQPMPGIGDGLHNGPAPQMPDNRLAQAAAAAPEVIVAFLPYVAPPMTDKERKALDKSVRELVKTVERLVSSLSQELHTGLKKMEDDVLHWVKADVRFPSAADLGKELGVSQEEFHREVKKEILDQLGREARRIGSTNPDIGIGPTGDIVLRNPKTGATVETDVPLDSFAR